ncbi:metallophosphoesterase [Geomesophilobacter sediminis]|uniref:Metallophosphoesterase family protein n=1 Tax=Geomesophilobacter sediminis TaxID=2798584 RepID=A0A8J7J106_9BACT|nr:metallophosphoesterase family protein [Geomesophilobacter sediminis]MBJ6724228.1 metallophosphoesterase family protein [Geomesophilobacter sediminis]
MKSTLRNLGLAAAFSLVGTSAFAGVLKKPYLMYEMPNTTMTVLWQDDGVETTNVVNWYADAAMTQLVGTSGPVAEETRPGTVNQHYFKITGLQPNTKYYYQVSDPTNGVYGTGSFTTAPDESTTHVRFIGQGDSRSNPALFNNILKAISGFTAIPGNEEYQRLSIHNGDWVATDAEANWTNEWFKNTNFAAQAYTANTPIDGVKGNHDNSSGYTTYFTKYFPFPYPAKTLKAGTTSTYNNLYWSMDYGPVHITFIDSYSSYAPGSQQYNWLVNDLASTTKPWKIVSWHDSSYSAGSDADNTSIRALEPLLAQYNVDLTYHGHSHNYARTGAYTASQANGDQIALGVPHYTSGGGGAGQYQPDMTNNGNYPHVITAWPANEFMTFDVNGNTMTMTAWQVTGAASNSTDYPLSSAFPGSDGNSGNLYLEKIETTVLHHFNANVTPQVNVTTTGFLFSRATGLYTANLTVKNNGPALSGNVHVVLDGILNLPGLGTPSNMYSTVTPKLTSMIANRPASSKNNPDPGLIATLTLTNQTGSHNGEPMIKVSSNGIPAGGSVTVPITFKNPSNINITFNPIVFQE